MKSDFNFKELQELISFCRKNGVYELKYGDAYFRIDPSFAEVPKNTEQNQEIQKKSKLPSMIDPSVDEALFHSSGD